MAKNKQNIYSLSVENLKFLRIFQFMGIFPIQLMRNENNFAVMASHVWTVVLIMFIILRFFVKVTQAFQAIQFGWDMMMLLTAQLISWLMIDRLRKFLQLLGEIDVRIENVLGMRQLLMARNVKMQRMLTITWSIYAIASMYYPVSRIATHGFSLKLLDSLFRVISWSFLLHIVKAKFLYCYSILSVRLEIIKQCLIDMQEEKPLRDCFLIREISRDKFSKHFSHHSKIMALKEIYDRCWLIQAHVYQLSGIFLMFYLTAYIGQIIYLMFFYIKTTILEETFEDEFLEIVLWLVLLNVFIIFYFIVSQKINTLGLRISGLIHNVAHNNVNDPAIVKAVQLFSLQIMQQPMTTISVLGLFYFDRTNLNGVSEKCSL